MVFWGAFALALALYAGTAPDGLPWNGSTGLALAYLGEVARLPAMPHPLWGYYVQVLGGPVALSAFAAALAAGFLGALVCRCFGWRFAVCAVLLWTFMPGVWNRAVTGERSICLVSMAVVALWTLNAVLWRILKKVRAIRKATSTTTDGDVVGADEIKKSGRRNRIAGWSALGAAGVFALVSPTLHDYTLGEPASVFARGVAEAAAGRIVVLNGVLDGQMARALGSRADDFRTICLRGDEDYRRRLVAWAKSAFPAETNLWVSAQVSPQAFVDSAVKRLPERFYLMNGASTTRTQWEERWRAFEPYLGSSDPFVRTARRLFGYEGNAVANAMLDGRDPKSDAWHLYRRIYDEVDPGNVSALANMCEMIRRGHVVSAEEKRKVQERFEAFLKDANNRKHMREIVRAAGPVRADPELMEELVTAAKKRIVAKIAAGEKVEFAPELLSLVEWNNEMCRLMDRNELVSAGRIARAILSNPKWRAFMPANAVMGSLSAFEGDPVASERFFRVATDTTNRVATVVLNDYADTLMHLGKLDEAEKIARRAVAQSDETVWLARLTLAEVLERQDAAAKGEAAKGEIGALLKSVLKHAPEQVRERVRREHRGFFR